MRGDNFFEFPAVVQGQPNPNNNWLPVMLPVTIPLSMVGLFKEYRCIGVRVWFRLRYPPPVEYFYDEDDKLVGSRCSIHEIYYYPSGKFDQPTINPRLSRGAREVTTAWQRTFVKLRGIRS